MLIVIVVLWDLAPSWSTGERPSTFRAIISRSLPWLGAHALILK